MCLLKDFRWHSPWWVDIAGHVIVSEWKDLAEELPRVEAQRFDECKTLR
jgi:hypothetical protein